MGGDPDGHPGAAGLIPPRRIPGGFRGLVRPLAFAMVGLANTGVDFAVFLALTRLAGVAPLLASAVGFLAGAVHSYFANGLLKTDSTWIRTLAGGGGAADLASTPHHYGLSFTYDLDGRRTTLRHPLQLVH